MSAWEPRAPGVLAVLGAMTPVATHEQSWGSDGEVPVRLNVHLGAIPLAEAEVLSVRVLVRVDQHVVCCTDLRGRRHPWPGGRLEAGETFADTACREVREETGWILDPETLRPLGWLHIEKLLDHRPADHPWPHKDMIHVVWTGAASERIGGRDNPWTDTEGFELSSELLTLDEAIDAATTGEPAAIPFLHLLR